MTPGIRSELSALRASVAHALARIDHLLAVPDNDPNGTWAKLEALAGKVAGIADEVDMSDDFDAAPLRFTGTKEATIAKLAAVDPALAADVARANGVD